MKRGREEFQSRPIESINIIKMKGAVEYSHMPVGRKMSQLELYNYVEVDMTLRSFWW